MIETSFPLVIVRLRIDFNLITLSQLLLLFLYILCGKEHRFDRLNSIRAGHHSGLLNPHSCYYFYDMSSNESFSEHYKRLKGLDSKTETDCSDCEHHLKY